MTIEDMRYDLAEYYECAGFKDVYNRVIKHKSDEEIVIMYKDVYCDDKIQLNKDE